MSLALLIALVFLTGMVFAAAVISLCLAGADDESYERRELPENERETERRGEWQWPARAIGPTAESHLGKTKVSEQPRRTA